jgi:hypothetical protein
MDALKTPTEANKRARNLRSARPLNIPPIINYPKKTRCLTRHAR